jgi:hypothetical protein
MLCGRECEPCSPGPATSHSTANGDPYRSLFLRVHPRPLFVPWLGKGAGQDRFFTPVPVREETSYVLTDI